MNEATEGLLTLLTLIWVSAGFFCAIVFLLLVDNEP
jgi:hypothetical protein